MGYSLHGVYLLQPRISEQTETGNAKDCVEDVDHVSRSISQPTEFGILFSSARHTHSNTHNTDLALQDELRQLLAVDPMKLVQHGHAAHHPPAVTDVLLLLGPPVQPTVLELTFAKPSSQLLLIYQVKPPRDGQCTYTRKHLT